MVGMLILIPRVNKNIVKVDENETVQKIRENIINEVVKDGGGIG